MGEKRVFTLVEIMIVVAVVGLLAAIAVPSFERARKRALANRFAKDIQVAAGAFMVYAIETGDYPADKTPAVMPEGMAAYLVNIAWSEPTVLGGRWDWDYQQFGVTAGVSVYQPTCGDEMLEMVDDILDDGDLSGGRFRSRSGGYIYVIE